MVISGGYSLVLLIVRFSLFRVGVSGGYSDDCIFFWDDSLEIKFFFKKIFRIFR